MLTGSSSEGGVHVKGKKENFNVDVDGGGWQ